MTDIVHNDLHLANILILDLGEEHRMTMTYDIFSKKIILYVKYIPIIIDYGRMWNKHISDKIKYDYNCGIKPYFGNKVNKLYCFFNILRQLQQNEIGFNRSLIESHINDQSDNSYVQSQQYTLLDEVPEHITQLNSDSRYIYYVTSYMVERTKMIKKTNINKFGYLETIYSKIINNFKSTKNDFDFISKYIHSHKYINDDLIDDTMKSIDNILLILEKMLTEYPMIKTNENKITINITKKYDVELCNNFPYPDFFGIYK